MKKKTLLTVLLVFALMLSLTACGAKSADSMTSEEMKYDNGFGVVGETAPAMESAESQSSSVQQEQTDRKIIKRVYMDVETEDLDATVVELNRRISDAGGYIEDQEQYNGGYSSYRSRSASMTVRVPAENLDAFVSQVEGISNVVSFRQNQEDVTLNYVATESRVAALQAEEARLLEFMSQAETMQDLLDIEDRLTDVRYELESVTSQLRVLSNQVSYATVYLNIDQVQTFTPVAKQSVWERISAGFMENLQDIGEDLEDFFVWLVVYLPQLVIFAVVVLVIVMVCRRSAKKRREKRIAQQQAYLRTPPQNPNGNPPQNPPQA